MKNKELLFKFLNGKLTPQESELLKKWLDSDAENRKLLQEMKVIWKRTQNYPSHFKPDTFKALEKVYHIAGIEPLHRKFRIKTMARVAAIAAIIIGVVVFMHYFYVNSSGKEMVVVTGPQEIKEVILPDSTHVWLNANSQLKYPGKYATRERKVQLNGEGYFEVHRNIRSPFLVDMGKSTVKVLGTHFNIQAYKNEIQTMVSVTEGKVQYTVKGSKQSLILETDERAILNNALLNIRKEKIASKNFLAWKTHVLEFRNTPLADVIRTLSIHYHKGYKLINNSSGKVPINAMFNNKTLDEIVISLSMATNKNIELNNDTITLK